MALTGTQLGSYGFDLESGSLTSLVESVLRDTDIERLRVSSLQPKEVTDELLALWADERLCPHFHMPLQSGSDRILSRMRRRYTGAEYEDTAKRIRERISHASVTADVIVGFPGETDTDFQATYDLCERMGFADMHVFPYSVRPGTSAAHYDEQTPQAAKKERMDAMLALAKRQARRFRKDRLGSTRPVLWESREMREGRVWWSGLTDNYIRVRAQSELSLLNVVTPGRLVECGEDGVVIAEVRQARQK